MFVHLLVNWIMEAKFHFNAGNQKQEDWLYGHITQNKIQIHNSEDSSPFNQVTTDHTRSLRWNFNTLL
jgi:hypothetical protein